MTKAPDADPDVPSPIDLRDPATAAAWAAEADVKRAILDVCRVESYTLFDFSTPMLEMCRQRVGDRAAIRFVLGDFTRDAWDAWIDASAPPFDAVVAIASGSRGPPQATCPAAVRADPGAAPALLASPRTPSCTASTCAPRSAPDGHHRWNQIAQIGLLVGGVCT
jgi:hypothetical protein